MATSRRCGASTSRSNAARCSPSWARTAPARRRPPRSSRATASRSAGDVSVLGADPATAGGEWRERIGIVLQQCRMRPELTVRETLELYAGYYRAPADISATIDHVGLGDKADDRARRPLRRPAAPPRRRRRADRRPRPALPRRADDRLRPDRPPPVLGGDRRAARPRQDGLPDHALHGRGAAARRPRRDHRGRPDRRRRAARTSSAGARPARPRSASGSRPGVAAGDLPAASGPSRAATAS